MDPINYQLPNIPNPSQSFMQGFQNGTAVGSSQIQQLAAAQQLQQRQLAFQQQQQQQAAITALANNPNPTANDYAKAITLVPQAQEAFSKAWSIQSSEQQQQTTSDFLQWGAAIKNNRPDVAISAMNAQADAFENAGQKQQAAHLRAQANIVQQNPQLGLAIIQGALAANPNGKQAADTLGAIGQEDRAAQKQPYDLAKAQADASKAQTEAGVSAATAPQQVTKANLDLLNTKSQIDERSANVANAAARTGLDRDRLQFDVDKTVAELQRKPGAIDLPESGVKIVNDSVVASQAARQSSAQMTDLASQLDQVQASGGAFGKAAEWFKNATGDQNYYSLLKNEYNRVRASEISKNLPPGAASDSDIKIAMSGFPSENADPKILGSFLRGMAKLQDYTAKVSDAKAEWVNQVGSLGTPSRDIQVGNTRIPKGTTFAEFAQQILKPAGAQTQTPAQDVKANLLQKYGQ